LQARIEREFRYQLWCEMFPSQLVTLAAVLIAAMSNMRFSSNQLVYWLNIVQAINAVLLMCISGFGHKNGPWSRFGKYYVQHGLAYLHWSMSAILNTAVVWFAVVVDNETITTADAILQTVAGAFVNVLLDGAGNGVLVVAFLQFAIAAGVVVNMCTPSPSQCGGLSAGSAIGFIVRSSQSSLAT
jgi:hypothetical protein